MNFQADMISAILGGRKTQTRRPVKQGDSLEPFTAGRCEVRNVNGRTRWIEGRRYSICPGRGKPRVGLIRILRITRERVDEISDADVRAEGFGCREEFVSRWRELYPGSGLSEDVWVLEFDRR